MVERGGGRCKLTAKQGLMLAVPGGWMCRCVAHGVEWKLNRAGAWGYEPKVRQSFKSDIMTESGIWADMRENQLKRGLRRPKQRFHRPTAEQGGNVTRQVHGNGCRMSENTFLNDLLKWCGGVDCRPCKASPIGRSRVRLEPIPVTTDQGRT